MQTLTASMKFMKSPPFTLAANLYITLHAFVDPKLSVEEAHSIAEKIEARMHDGIKPLENVTVHVEPSGVALTGKEVNEEQVRKVVNDAAKSIAPNLRITKILTYSSKVNGTLTLIAASLSKCRLLRLIKLLRRLKRKQGTLCKRRRNHSY